MTLRKNDRYLFRCKYGMDDQRRFSLLSGDHNPLHLDSVAARRTLHGAPVVHGVHLVLTGMEAALRWFLDKRRHPKSITELTANFIKPIMCGTLVEFLLMESSAEKCLISVCVENETACNLSIHFGETSSHHDSELPPLVKEKILSLDFNEMAVQEGRVPLGIDRALITTLFPRVVDLFGCAAISEILALTRLVGMRCPGLHSLFSGLNVRFNGKEAPGFLEYRIEKSDERFRSAVIGVSGHCLSGQLLVFCRPPPEQQPSIKEITHLIPRGSFASSVALIVGGNRGLGEITAKIIAAGGGLPIITYRQGSADAESVVNDIRKWGGRCEAIHLDVRKSKTAMRHLFRRGYSPGSLYYFASPKIFGRRRGFFDHDILQEFLECYVISFGRIIDAIRNGSGMKLRVFVPSSVAVQEDMRNMAEYVLAKRATEELCAFYSRYSTQVEIIVERLPRIRTDQTQTLFSVPAEEGLDVLLPIVRRMENPLPPDIKGVRSGS